ncbi:uncharacterized protein LOC142606314 [Castanea sativa]|uniref:uncharacterized protein LOC142606314 n=1 Tax=Castanea sativa TaxID=21020 RepID=UPI003F64A3B9
MSFVTVYVDGLLIKSIREDDHLDDLKEIFETLKNYNMKLNPNKCTFRVTTRKFLGFMVSQRGVEVNPDKVQAIMELALLKTTKEVQNLNGKIVALNRYDIPRVLILDNGKQFDNDAFRDLCSQLGINNYYFLPACPQTNSQVEVTNRFLLKIIKTQLEGEKGIWLEELPSVLWAYCTTARTSTGETPFRLAYGSEAVILVEVGLTSYRLANHDKEKNDDALRLQLDMVDEVKATVEQRMAWYQSLMARHYNSRVKHKDF